MISRKISFPLFVILFSSIIIIAGYAQTIVGEFGNYEITLDEFESAYAKNVGSREIAQNDSFPNYKNFMELYMNFRMKIRIAEVRGFDSDPALNQELTDYQEQVGESYIIEKYILQPGIEKLYEKRKEEIRVSHIMFRPVEGSDEKAFEMANAVLDSIKNGASFEEMAKKYSEDKFSGVKGGDIFYVTAGLLPYEFEDAMYTLQAGEVYPEPLKTNFGWHLIKVTQRQQRIPKIRASHILISYFGEDGKVDSAFAKLTADSVIAQLKEGVSFDSLVVKYSDDTGTKSKGGDLGYIERRQMVQAFDEVAFGLNVGEISDLVQTNFGYHIIKLLDREKYPTFDSDRENLKKLYQKQRYQADFSKYVDNLKNEYNYKLDNKTVDLIVENCDSSRFGIDYPNPDAIKDAVLFTFNGENVTALEFINKTNNTTDFAGKPIFINAEVLKAVDKFSEKMLMKTEAMNLGKKDPNFAALMGEYQNGVYIFKLQEDEIWNKLKVDSVMIYKYWEKHKENYSLPERITFGEIFSMKDSLIKDYYQSLKEGADFDSLATLHTERTGKKKDSGRYEMQAVDFSDLTREANKIANVGDFTEPLPFSGGYSIFKLFERAPERLKTFDEARAEVSGVVQESESKRLEKVFINKLNNIYDPVIYYDELKKAFKPKE